MDFLYFVIVATFLADPITAIDCSNNTCTRKGFQHVLCEYPSRIPSSDCGTVYSTGFTNDEIKEIVDAHNKLRSHVAQGLETRGNPGPQPGASNMRIMVWDDELAAGAQRWANQCIFQNARCIDVDRFEVGQLGGTEETTGNTLDTRPSTIINNLYEAAVQQMDRKQVCRRTNWSALYYVQFVWARTYRVGCGKIVRRSNGNLIFSVTCFYGPRGNVLGQSAYHILRN
ncbi:unnamed protein product [Xylocopa violacea]|uniref:SCP domain-containing protein n=1 Tax=Xylocopa violacea TaxID=135666 RepID=A0ABP1NE20_XYLVO